MGGSRIACKVTLLEEYDCVLYSKEFADLQHCPTCGEARYKEGFADMRWNRDKCVETNESLRHPGDAKGWKHFDLNFLILLMTHGTFRSPGKEIDVYLQPLIEELKELSTFGGGVQRGIGNVLYAWVIDHRSGYEVLELCAFENLSHDFISLATRPSFDVDCYNGFIVDTMSSFPCTNFLETDAMLLEFADDLDNLAGRLSWVGDNLTNGQIPMTIAPGAKKPISSHVVCFNQAISVCVRKTFPVRCLKWADVGKEYIKWFFVLDFNDQAMNRFVEHQMLRTFKEFQGDCHKNFKATPRRLMPTPKPIGGT
ncbi:CACTA en-spm transposon protein [Cucumis melo var. makuwa]|uniref:CACTA en-spm transposon protein n=1 Tax=Cucumis melo var. makuwa TaxID=1194695 RepID=A0A5D3C3F6_CUCMM|nr:CACTA en-spm transposon protein [Cucumis melo var. makuwa]TYK06453.1 CACTA en-spm transposon protein [Cucumis melo var. makuwa]